MNRAKLLTAVTALLALLLGTIVLDAAIPAISILPVLALPDGLQNFVTVFLGIFIEAAPFLLFGSLASGLIAAYVSADDIAAFFPRNRPLATVAGALLGIVFPVCECGVVPVVRRLSQKGLPISAGIAFLLAAPVINPVVIASTYAAFGTGMVFWGRLGFTLLVAIAVGLVFIAQPQLIKVLRPRALGALSGASAAAPDSPPAPRGSRLQLAFTTAAEDFFDVGRYLVIGSLLAAALQTFVPQRAMLAIGSGPIASVLALQALAYVLSVCSTVDAFLALSFSGSFTTGSIIAFLVFGPMVDIKSTLMYLGLFRRRPVIYIIALTFLITLLIGLFINLNISV
jgi:uncharacterized protein